MQQQPALPAFDAVDVGGAQPCADPECGGTAEPEQDGETGYLACTACGFEFGYHKVEAQSVPVDQQGSCAIGVPVSVRAAFSAPAGALPALRQAQPKPRPVSLGLTIPVRSDL